MSGVGDRDDDHLEGDERDGRADDRDEGEGLADRRALGPPPRPSSR